MIANVENVDFSSGIYILLKVHNVKAKNKETINLIR